MNKKDLIQKIHERRLAGYAYTVKLIPADRRMKAYDSAGDYQKARATHYRDLGMSPDETLGTYGQSHG